MANRAVLEHGDWGDRSIGGPVPSDIYLFPAAKVTSALYFLASKGVSPICRKIFDRN